MKGETEYKVGDLVKWDFQQYDDEGVCHDGVNCGLILEIKHSVSSRLDRREPTKKCYRVMFHEEDVFGVSEPFDLWLYGCEIIKMNKT